MNCYPLCVLALNSSLVSLRIVFHNEMLLHMEVVASTIQMQSGSQQKGHALDLWGLAKACKTLKHVLIVSLVHCPYLPVVGFQHMTQG